MYTIDRFSGSMDAVTDSLEKDGYIKKEHVEDGAHIFRAYLKDETCVFVNYFKLTNQTQVVTDKCADYFCFYGDNGDFNTKAQITQLRLEDFGMAYVIRLYDGRFIIIDGGWGFEPDIKRLFEFLKNGANTQKPIIALWIMTHPHCDHYHSFFPFYEQYKDAVIIERMMFNFPDADDTAHYPALCDRAGIYNLPETEMIPRFLNLVKQAGIPVYTAHTGQWYEIGGAKLEILSSLDDTYGVTKNLNATSLVIRMTIENQVILWGADASFEYASLCKRYGKYLKADILQVMHHGFGGGSAHDEALGYSYINPDVCLMPVIDYNAYINFCAHKGGVHHLMSAVDIKEMITGDKTVTLTLPYYPDGSALNVHREKYEKGQKSAGAVAWVFTNLDSSEKADFVFDILNMTSAVANVVIELYFEDRKSNVTFIRYTAKACSINAVDITDKDTVSTEDDYYNPQSFEKIGIAKGLPFAVRFLSDIPIVVSHKKHKETYHS